MRCLLRRSTCVWGRDIEMLTLRVTDPVGRGFLRPDHAGGPNPRELVIRPVLGQEHRDLDAVRRADGHWLRPWEATLPPDTLEHIPTFSQYMRRADRDHREGTGLIFGVRIDGRFDAVGAARRAGLAHFAPGLDANRGPGKASRPWCLSESYLLSSQQAGE